MLGAALHLWLASMARRGSKSWSRRRPGGPSRLRRGPGEWVHVHEDDRKELQVKEEMVTEAVMPTGRVAQIFVGEKGDRAVRVSHPGQLTPRRSSASTPCWSTM